MPSQQTIEVLKQGGDSWNNWRKSNPEVRPNLHKAKLQGFDLSNIDLRGVMLSGADLRGTMLQSAILSDADLSGAQLTLADVTGADLRNANLEMASIGGTILDGANLESTNLVKAYMAEASAKGASLRRADLRLANLSGADLEGVDASESSFQDTILRAANLTETLLVGSDLRKANLIQAVLKRADLTRAVLFETVLGNSILTDAIGLETCVHAGPSVIDHLTMLNSWPISATFLRGCGVPDTLIAYLPSLLSQPIQFYSCFLSYSHADKPFAMRLHDALQKHGVRCWLDERALLPGDDIYEQVDRGIRLWDKVLLCCSRDSLNSAWVQSEIEKAFAKEQALMKEHKQKFLTLVPLNLDGYLFSNDWKNPFAHQLRSRMAADFTEWNDDEVKFNNQVDTLLLALRQDEAARERPPISKL